MKNDKIQLVKRPEPAPVEKPQKSAKKPVKTWDLISILVLGGVVSVMIFYPWGLDTREAELVRAQQKAEVVAYQIIEIYKEAKIEAPTETSRIQTRGLASVQSRVEAGGVMKEFKNQGTMGIDPWGHPYQYRILAVGSESKLVVWSLGPNGILDTQVLASESNEAFNEPLLGDDIRVQMPLPEAGSR